MPMKTVVCAACQAEQAIERESAESTTMSCVFCGEEIELPPYEEGEAEAYSYESEEKPEETLAPEGENILSTFVLSEEEVGTAFTVSGRLKERKWILYIETALLILLGAFMLIASVLGIMGKAGFKAPSTINWVYVVLCFGMLPVIWISPQKTKKKIIKNATSGNQLSLSIYENLIHIHIEGNDPDDDWQQPFDGSFGVIEQENMFVLTLKSGQILVIPHRSLTEEQVDVVRTRLNGKIDCEA